MYDYEDKKKKNLWSFNHAVFWCTMQNKKIQGSCYIFHSILYYHPLQLNFLDETTLEEEEAKERKARKCRESRCGEGGGNFKRKNSVDKSMNGWENMGIV